jgi:N-acetylglutamate synthase-like GNAT family acetyltransferase
MDNILKVESNSEVDAVAKLAREIWQQHFTPIIGDAQVEYMLNKFQSSKAIESQLYEGWEYYITMRENEYVGYTGIVPNVSCGKMLISKIYVKDRIRGSGVGNLLLDFIEDTSKARGLNTVWLTVNRYNEDTIKWYYRHGFVTVDEVKKDIGAGFIMDDFIMEKKI